MLYVIIIINSILLLSLLLCHVIGRRVTKAEREEDRELPEGAVI